MDLDALVPKAMARDLRRSAEHLRGTSGRVRVLCHFDGDGILASVILARLLDRQGREYHLSNLRSLRSEDLEVSAVQQAPVLILADFGSSHLDLLPAGAIVLDHHRINTTNATVHLVNPEVHDLVGGKEGCSAILAFLFGLALDEANADLVDLALIGAVADRQHLGGFKGIDKLLLEAAIAQGSCEVRTTLAVRDGPLAAVLAEATDPFLLPFAGDPVEARRWLREYGLDPDASLGSLTVEQTRHLNSALLLELSGLSLDATSLGQVVAERFWLPALNGYASELAEVMDSCGRAQESSLALEALAGTPAALAAAEHHAAELRRLVRPYLIKVAGGDYADGLAIRTFNVEEPAATSPTCSIAILFLFPAGKAVLAYTRVEDQVKFSGRGTDRLIEQGLDLAGAFRTVASSMGGEGGGHKVAAGATVAVGQEQDFIAAVDTIIAEQLGLG